MQSIEERFMGKFKNILNDSLSDTIKKITDGFGIGIDLSIPNVYQDEHLDDVYSKYMNKKYVLSLEFHGVIHGSSLWFIDEGIINFFKEALPYEEESEYAFVRNCLCEIHNILTCSYMGGVLKALNAEADFDIVNIYEPKELLNDIKDKLLMVETTLNIEGCSTNLEQMILISEEVYDKIKEI